MMKPKSLRTCFRSFVLLLCCFSISVPSIGIEGHGELEWPEVTMEARPWTRWWIQGSAVTKEDITAVLEAYQKAGLGGVEITPIYGVRGIEDQFIEYLSPHWVEMLEYTLKEAQRLGMGVDLANASGWPFGGPWVDDDTACKSLRTKTYRLKGGESFSEKIEYIQKPMVYTQSGLKVDMKDVKYPVTANEDLQETDFAQIWYERSLPLVVVTANRYSSSGKEIVEVIDLTDKVEDGILHWTAPEGDWLVCAFFQGWHGKMVERAAPGAEGNVIDHFSEEATKKYLDRFSEAFKGYDTSYLRYYFNDSYEVDDAAGSADWTPEMFREFRRICGYDLKEYLPALLGMADEETNRRVLHDYRAVVSELMLECFTKPWQQWAARQGKGIRNQAHGSPANALDLYAASDVPEMEGSTISDIKAASSAAHLTGKRLTSAESCTLLNEHFQSKLSDVKAANDRFLLGGVNHIFYHGTDYSPMDAPWPGRLFYAAVHFTPANSFWDDFGALNRYVARAQSFLQAGKPSNDVLLYYGISDLWSAPAEKMFHYFHSFDTASMGKCGRFLLSNGYSWDAASDKLLQEVTFKDGRLLAGGNAYKVIIVPELEYMPVATFAKLLGLAKAGATVLFYGGLPSDVPGLAHLDRDRKRMEHLKKGLSFVEEGDVRACRYGKGRIVIMATLQEGLEQTDVRPESMYAQGLQCIRRLKEDGNYYYFILNPSKKVFSGWVSLNAGFRACALFNPMTGDSGYAETRETGGRPELWLELKPNESMIVETFQNDSGGKRYPYYQVMGEGLELADWKVSFVKGGPSLPAAKQVRHLGSWTEYGDEYARFSGTAEYEIQLPVLSEGADAWRLHFDEVHESAAVYLNDVYLGTLLEAPYELDIPADLLKGNDVLKVRVSNLMANRIAYMDKQGMKWRIFYNANVESKGRANIGKDGKFSAEKWEPMPSGLSGKATLQPLSFRK